MATTADFKKGLCIDMNNDLWQIVDFQHVKPGKGNAFVRTKLKSLSSGKVVENTFQSGHNIETARIERRKFQYLYNDETGWHFMNNDTFDQVAIDKEMISNTGLLKEGQEVDILFHAETEKALTCELPANVILEVTYSEPGVKGDTATNVTKIATVETGANVNVPLFVNVGDKIKVDTETNKYVERVKE
ncbi:MAG: elongation factor P [Bacteroidota bacterium]